MLTPSPRIQSRHFNLEALAGSHSDTTPEGPSTADPPRFGLGGVVLAGSFLVGDPALSSSVWSPGNDPTPPMADEINPVFGNNPNLIEDLT